jgi:type II secretory pathway pseudopilin PulG
MMSANFRYQRGYSLLELGIVLTVVGLVIGGIWIYAGTANENNRINKLNAQALAIITNARKTFGNAGTPLGNFTAVNMTLAAVQAGVFPQDMVPDGDGVPTNAFGGITYLGHSATTPPYFRLSLSNINQAACVTLLSKTVRDYETRRLYGIFGVSASTTAGALGAHQDLPRVDITPQQITDYCALANNGARMTITLDFKYL